jgi:hypothetical protein
VAGYESVIEGDRIQTESISEYSERVAIKGIYLKGEKPTTTQRKLCTKELIEVD